MTEAKTDEQYETPAVVVGQKRQNSDNGGPASKRPNVGDPEGEWPQVGVQLSPLQCKSRC